MQGRTQCNLKLGIRDVTLEVILKDGNGKTEDKFYYYMRISGNAIRLSNEVQIPLRFAFLSGEAGFYWPPIASITLEISYSFYSCSIDLQFLCSQ